MGIKSVFEITGQSMPTISFKGTFLMNLPAKSVPTAPISVAVVPRTMSIAPYQPKKFAIKQPTVKPMAHSGKRSGRMHKASLKRIWNGP